jgi:hypothetical protein
MQAASADSLAWTVRGCPSRQARAALFEQELETGDLLSRRG